MPTSSLPRRALRWLLGVLAVLLALLVAAAVVLAHWDWNRARPWINDKVSEATGRRFAIEGDLSADWHWPQPLEQGWRRWVPGVTVQAKQLVMDNPPGFAIAEAPQAGDKALPAVPRKTAGENKPVRDAQTMGTIAQASATLRLLPLLARTVALDTVELTAPDIVLGRRADGSNNWTLKSDNAADQSSSPWSLSLGQLVIRDGWLGYADGAKDLALRVHVDTTDGDATDGTPPGQAPGKYGVRATLQGRYGKARVEGEGQAGHLLTLREQTVNYPLRFKARAGNVRAEAEGTLANPAALSGMDLQVMLQAGSMADLFDLTGLVLPSTPPFQTRGRLVGSLQPGRATWEYRDFQGTVGESDLHGSLTYTSAQPRPRLQGTMTSKQLRLADLGPVVGAPSGEGKSASTRPGKVLPDAPFATDRWNAMDMDITFTGERILRPESLPIENLSVHAVLDNAQLTLSPLRFGVAQGRIDSKVVLDSRTQPLKTQLHGTVEGLKLSALFPKVELMDKSFGRLDGAVALSASGNSVARMLGSSSGEARLYIRDGTFSKQLLDLAALNVGSVVVAKLFGENKEVRLRCAVADFAVKDGVAQTRSVKLSTEEAVVEAVGTVDLRNEYLDLRVKPESLQWKFFSLRTPLYVRGDFAAPKVGLEPGPLLLRAGAAVAAVAVAPAALALVPVTVPAAEDDANCAVLLQRANEAVKAGKAGAAPKPEKR
ncbi:MAG: AsmA family protein [Acidovorax sp.]|uniref:AsmA family protein n=1 Tax=Acidovorax sp. TaxID=1872122 RepID=UPI0039E3297A